MTLLISSYSPTLFTLKFKLRKLVRDGFKGTGLSSTLQIKITEAKVIYGYEKFYVKSAKIWVSQYTAEFNAKFCLKWYTNALAIIMKK